MLKITEEIMQSRNYNSPFSSFKVFLYFYPEK